MRDFSGNPGFKLLNKDLATTGYKELVNLVEDPVDANVHLAAKASVRPRL